MRTTNRIFCNSVEIPSAFVDKPYGSQINSFLFLSLSLEPVGKQRRLELHWLDVQLWLVDRRSRPSDRFSGTSTCVGSGSCGLSRTRFVHQHSRTTAKEHRSTATTLSPIPTETSHTTCDQHAVSLSATRLPKHVSLSPSLSLALDQHLPRRPNNARPLTQLRVSQVSTDGHFADKPSSSRFSRLVQSIGQCCSERVR